LRGPVFPLLQVRKKYNLRSVETGTRCDNPGGCSLPEDTSEVYYIKGENNQLKKATKIIPQGAYYILFKLARSFQCLMQMQLKIIQKLRSARTQAQKTPTPATVFRRKIKRTPEEIAHDWLPTSTAAVLSPTCM
jgi:hypothetical protein